MVTWRTHISANVRFSSVYAMCVQYTHMDVFVCVLCARSVVYKAPTFPHHGMAHRIDGGCRYHRNPHNNRREQRVPLEDASSVLS